MRRTLPPSRRYKLTSTGCLDRAWSMTRRRCSVTSRGSGLVDSQRAVEEEFDGLLGRARYERLPSASAG